MPASRNDPAGAGSLVRSYIINVIICTYVYKKRVGSERTGGKLEGGEGGGGGACFKGPCSQGCGC